VIEYSVVGGGFNLRILPRDLSTQIGHVPAGRVLRHASFIKDAPRHLRDSSAPLVLEGWVRSIAPAICALSAKSR